MRKVDYRGLGGKSLGLLCVGLAPALVACSMSGGDAGDPESPDAVEQTVTGCSFTVSSSAYVGSPDYWGTLVFKNTGAAALKQPQVSFNVPAGVKCDYDDAGWKHTQSGATCTFTRTSSLTIAAGASYTFHFSTDSSASFKATSVQLGDPSCAGGSTSSSSSSSSTSSGAVPALIRKAPTTPNRPISPTR